MPQIATSGSFKPGNSGNPGGRPAAARDVSVHARRYAIEMINVLIKLARTASAEAVRKAAATEVPDRASGQAPKSVDLTLTKKISEMSLEELSEREGRGAGRALQEALEPPRSDDLFAGVEDEAL